MVTISGSDINEVYDEALWKMRVWGLEEESRGGRVLVAPYPVITETRNPMRRVLFHAQRDANPFFHLMEAMWMLAGRNDLAFVENYNPRMAEFADEGVIRGGYGARWRKHFVEEGGDYIDQPEWVGTILRNVPTSRQAVIQMWDVNEDLGSRNRDIPCNTHIYFRVHNKALDMTVTCRSNDIIWGAYGANAVHFSFLQEWVAAVAKLPVGRMFQFANNWHIYERHWHLLHSHEHDGVSPYDKNLHGVVPILQPLESLEWFKEDLKHLDDLGNYDAKTNFFRIVVQPMAEAHRIYRKHGAGAACGYLEQHTSSDWTDAGVAWLMRRIK